MTTEELFEVDDWMRNFERDMDADRSRIQRLKEKVLTPGELYMIIGMLTALRVSHDSADKRLASQVDTYPLNQGQIPYLRKNCSNSHLNSHALQHGMSTM